MAFNAFQFGFVDQVSVKQTLDTFENYFEGAIEDEHYESESYMRVKDNVKYVLSKEGQDKDYLIADYNNDVYYTSGNYVVSDVDVIMSSMVHLLESTIDINKISVENIYDVSINEDGAYVFTVIV
jgi:hypothetical protein